MRTFMAFIGALASACVLPANAYAQTVAQAAEHVAEVRIHGNHTTPDEEVIKLTGITLGEGVTAETLPQVAKRSAPAAASRTLTC